MARTASPRASKAGHGKKERRHGGERLVPVHTVVPGRARVRVGGLRRSPALKVRIESELAGLPQVQDVVASIRSGSVLVRFDPALPLDTLLAHLAEILPDRPLRPTRGPDAGAKRSNPTRSAGDGANAEVEPWHRMDVEQVVSRLQSDIGRGLDDDEAARRIQRFGANVLPGVAQRSRLAIAAEQFASLPVALLGVSAGISVLTGGLADAVMIVAVLGINAAIGYVTESHAERTIGGLAGLVRPSATVVRGGTEKTLPSEDVVPGDVLCLAAGTIVAADARVVAADRLTVDESPLTGESEARLKNAGALDAADVPLADRVNMVFRGTPVTGGSGRAVVVATGAHTEIAHIQSMVAAARPPETPMQRQLATMGSSLAWISSGTCLAIFAISLVRGEGLLSALRGAVSLAVAAVPEGLPMVATTTLALGIHKMRREHVLVRRLAAIETLGAVQTLCFDKTGTLTRNRMTVEAVACGDAVHAVADGGFRSADGREVEPGSHPALPELLAVAVLCNDTIIEAEGDGPPVLHGSGTEVALVELALKAGVDVTGLRAARRRIATEHRSEDRNVMTTVHEMPGRGRYVAVKGRPAEVLGMCSRLLAADGPTVLTEEHARAIEQQDADMASAALRVLGFAKAEGTGEAPATDRDLTWLGLAGMADPLRDGTPELMRIFHRAGIDTAMITGDQSPTAYAIAKKLDLSRGEEMEILDSTRLEGIDPAALMGLAKRVHVFARITPAHKLAIIRALQEGGRVVAMTGDGINDSPALKAADIGVAVGSSGSDVAREVADIVLEKDDLSTMATAIAEGRTIYDNIRKSLHYLLSTNLSEIIVTLTATAAGLGQPLSPMQLLWINMMSDVLPGLALAVEEQQGDVMEKPPRDPEEPILPHRTLAQVAFEGTVISAGSLATYLFGVRRHGIGPAARTMGFFSLVLAQLLHALSCRTPDRSLAERRRLPVNKALYLGLAGSFAAQGALVAIPPLRRLMGIAPLGLAEFAATAAGGIVPMAVIEGAKLVRHAAAPRPDQPVAAAPESRAAREQEEARTP